MTTEDRAAITDVIVGYGAAVDARDRDAVLACFTDDVCLEYFNGEVVINGIDEARDFFQLDKAGALPGLDAVVSMTHLWNVGTIAVNGEQASSSTTCVAYVLGTSGGDGVLVTRGLRYVDELQRSPAGWRIRRRRHIPEWETRTPATSPLVAAEDEVQAVAAGIAGYLTDTSSLTDPYPLYRRLRQLEPVHWSEALGYWVVTSHAEAEACFRDPRLSRHDAGARQFGWIAAPDDPPDIKRAVTAWCSTILNLDPPDHTRLRKLISRAFTVRAVSAWKARTEEIVDGILKGLRDTQELDLLKEIGYPVPETVICEVLGVPVEDHDRWKAWNGGLNRAAIFAGRNKPGDDLPLDVRRLAQDAVMRWHSYFSELVARRRGGDGHDLVSALVRAEEEGDRLSETELVGTLTLLVGAGHDTVANLIANGMLALMRNPDQYALLRAEPRRAGDVVEEVLRYDGSARGQPRVALEDMIVGGRTISAGDSVMVIVNAANRDPARFPDPDRFDITRGDTGHLAFASGIHFCVGAALARMEAEVVFRKIAELDVVFELATDELSYRPTHGRNLTALPVRTRHAG